MIRGIWLAAILTTFGVACALPAVKFLHDDKALFQLDDLDTRGYQCLLAAGLALAVPAWNANPLFFAGCLALALRRDLLALWLGGAASALAASYAWFADGHHFPAVQIGFYFWMASLLGLTLAAYLFRRRARLGLAMTVSHETSPASDLGSSSASGSSSPLSSTSPS